MGQPSGPPPPIPSPPPPPPPPPSSLPPLPAIQGSANGSGCQVRCAGCKMILTVAAGLTEFICPKCDLPQMLPPELLRSSQQQQLQQRSAPAHGIDPTKIQLPCAHCKAILNVPHGLSRFNCPQCGIDLAVDLSKIRQFFPPPLPGAPPFHLPLPSEEVNEVFPVYSFISTVVWISMLALLQPQAMPNTKLVLMSDTYCVENTAFLDATGFQFSSTSFVIVSFLAITVKPFL